MDKYLRKASREELERIIGGGTDGDGGGGGDSGGTRVEFRLRLIASQHPEAEMGIEVALEKIP